MDEILDDIGKPVCGAPCSDKLRTAPLEVRLPSGEGPTIQDEDPRRLAEAEAPAMPVPEDLEAEPGRIVGTPVGRDLEDAGTEELRLRPEAGVLLADEGVLHKEALHRRGAPEEADLGSRCGGTDDRGEPGEDAGSVGSHDHLRFEGMPGF
jgi:hypothetical protein